MAESKKLKDYLEKLARIPVASFNAEQKQIAQSILENTPEKDLDKVYGLITQRVKTGFVFDAAPEVNHNCVALVEENPNLNINTDKILTNQTEHKLIIGENYDALKNLCAAYIDKNGNGLIDVIYIDPPYNTEKTKEEGNDYKTEVEASKFVYRDKFTRDGWLNMMNERLKLARRLLSDKGVIFISIDDSEQAYLKVLCDEIFGEENFCGDIIWNSTKSVTNTALISVSHTYNLVYFKEINYYIENRTEFRLPDNGEGFENPDNDPRGAWKADPFQVGGWRPNQQYTIINPKTGIEYRPNPDCSWKNDYEKFQELLKDNRIVFGKTGDSGPQRKRFIWEAEERGRVVKTLWDDVGTTTNGTQLIKKIFDDVTVFNNPKPVELIKRMLLLGTNKNSIVLDFFAGSGTTGQAVMELNEEDGGSRKCILVTNNENNIALNVTRERLFRVINGKGSKGEEIKWEYSKNKKVWKTMCSKCLKSNTIRLL
jgi:adenine specific DNA methylase Mod